jgi:hypothetical protein
MLMLSPTAMVTPGAVAVATMFPLDSTTAETIGPIDPPPAGELKLGLNPTGKTPTFTLPKLPLEGTLMSDVVLSATMLN